VSTRPWSSSTTTGDLYDLELVRATDRDAFREAFAESFTRDGTQVIEVPFDAESSHGVRDRLAHAVHDTLPDSPPEDPERQE